MKKILTMKRILITGMSGTGKSSVVEELRSRGFAAVDFDYGDWCELVVQGRRSEWLWREDKVRELLTAPLSAPLFVSGCSANQGMFYPFFDDKILLSAPFKVLLERVTARASNPYGKTPEEQEAIRRDMKSVQPLLRQGANYEIDTTVTSVREIAEFLIGLAEK